MPPQGWPSSLAGCLLMTTDGGAGSLIGGTPSRQALSSDRGQQLRPGRPGLAGRSVGRFPFCASRPCPDLVGPGGLIVLRAR